MEMMERKKQLCTSARLKVEHAQLPELILMRTDMFEMEKGASVWHTDFSWVAGDGNSISKTSRRLFKTLESGFLPANHRQLLHTLINHMQMSLQRHWGMIRTLSPLLHNKGEKKWKGCRALVCSHRRRENFLSSGANAATCGEIRIEMRSNHLFFA